MEFDFLFSLSVAMFGLLQLYSKNYKIFLVFQFSSVKTVHNAEFAVTPAKQIDFFFFFIFQIQKY